MVDHVAKADIETLELIPGAYGRHVAKITFRDPIWTASKRWYFGEQQPVDKVPAGDSLRIIVDTGWNAQLGPALVAVSTLPVNGYDGTLVAIFDDRRQPEVFAEALKSFGENSSMGDATRAYFATAAEFRKLDLASLTSEQRTTTDLLLDMVYSARTWTDDKNQIGSTAAPSGLGGQVDRALYDDDNTGSVDRATQEAERLLQQRPELRQIPADQSVLEALAKQMNTPLVPITGALFDHTKRGAFFAIHVESFGVLGPWSLDPELHYGRLHGVIPQSSSGTATVLLWETNDPQPNNAIARYPLSIPGSGEQALQIDLTSDKAKISELHIAALTLEIDELLATRK